MIWLLHLANLLGDITDWSSGIEDAFAVSVAPRARNYSAFRATFHLRAGYDAT